MKNPFKAIGRGAKKAVTAPVDAVRRTKRLLTIRARADDVLQIAEDAEADPRLYRDPAWRRRLLTAVLRLVAVLPIAPEIRDMTFLKNILANYKTTAAGIAMIAAAIAAVANGTPLTDPTVMTGILGGIGLILGKDASKTGVIVKPTEPTEPAK